MDTSSNNKSRAVDLVKKLEAEEIALRVSLYLLQRPEIAYLAIEAIRSNIDSALIDKKKNSAFLN